MGKALGMVLIVVASGLLIYWFVVPLFVAPVTHTVPTPQAANPPPPYANPVSDTTQSTAQPAAARIASGQSTQSAPSDTSLPPPRTPEQQQQDDLEAKRAPYYRWLREQAGDRVTEVSLASDDRAILVLYTAADSADIVPALVRDVIAPAAYRYGFRHVRFFVPNPAGSVSQYRFDAESNADADGNWHTFHK